jgi:hypothetical protein
VSDLGAVVSGESRKRPVLRESELERLGVVRQTLHPVPTRQTCGKVERFHQTLKRYFGNRAEGSSLAVLQAQLDTFGTYCSHPGLTAPSTARRP